MFTGLTPYHEIGSNYLKAGAAISDGKTPDRTRYPAMPPDDDLWDVLILCWTLEPGARSCLQDIRGLIQSRVSAPRSKIEAWAAPMRNAVKLASSA